MVATADREHVVRLRGAVADLMWDVRDREVMVAGPYGTGKTRGVLEYIHRSLLQYPGARALIARRTAISLTNSALVTFREQVLQSGEARYFGGSKDRPAAYQYPNGSEAIAGGLDNPDKVLSTEYDLVYIVEATDVPEVSWESCAGRLRHGAMPYQQIVGDCNPRGPNHWIKKRADRKQLRLLSSRHTDNPAYWDGYDWTPAGRAYRDLLSSTLTGVRRERFLEGKWAAAEGIIYGDWDEQTNVLRPQVLPREWPRVWSLDFGATNPFVCQSWALDPDDRMVLEWEIYRTGRLVEDHARRALELAGAVSRGGVVDWSRGIRPRDVVCDHDAEGRLTFTKYTGLKTTPAYKDIGQGIQAVQARLRPATDGRPRLFLLDDALRDRDTSLDDAMKPASTAEEWDSYVWDSRRELPVKENDHGMDATRYAVCLVDHIGRSRMRAW